MAQGVRVRRLSVDPGVPGRGPECLARLEHYDPDHAARAGLVRGVLALVDLVGARPEAGALLALGDPGAHRDPPAAHLYILAAPGAEVVEPPRLLGRSTARGRRHPP